HEEIATPFEIVRQVIEVRVIWPCFEQQHRPTRIFRQTCSQGTASRSRSDDNDVISHRFLLLYDTSAARCRSPVAGSRSDLGASAGGSQGQRLVRCGGACDARTPPTAMPPYTVGGMFWLWRNRFVGSYVFFRATSRS